MKTPPFLTLTAVAVAWWLPLPVHSQNLNPAAGSTILPNQHKPEGFVMIGNRVHVVSQGVARPLEEPMVLRITADGIIGFDNVQRIIRNNSMLAMDGRIVAAPEVLAVPETSLVAQPPPADLGAGSDYLVYGTNVSGLSPSRTVVNRSGPRFISTKKSSVKARAVTAKRKPSSKVTAKAAPASKTVLPAFNDSVLPLPGVATESSETISPTIDATSTMLYMTAAPDAEWTPEAESIGASLGVEASINPPSAEASSPAPVTPPLLQPDSFQNNGFLLPLPTFSSPRANSP